MPQANEAVPQQANAACNEGPQGTRERNESVDRARSAQGPPQRSLNRPHFKKVLIMRPYDRWENLYLPQMHSRYSAYSLEHDPVYVIAMRENHLHNVQSLAHFAHPLELVPWTLWRANVHQPLVYLAVRQSLGVRRALKLSSTAAEKEMGVQNLVLSDIDGCIISTLSEWLAGLGVPELEHCTGARGYDLQHKWWSRRGKFCDFLALPVLVQRKILLHVVGEVCAVVDRSSSQPAYLLQAPESRIEAFVSCNWFPTYAWNNNTVPICQSILRTNKTVRQEMQNIMQHHVTKRFGRAHIFDELTFLPEFPRLDFLSRLQLALSDRDFLHFIGADVECAEPHRIYSDFPGCPAVALSTMPNVRYLEFYFESIHSCKGCLRPCAKPIRDDQNGNDEPGLTTGACELERPCRKAMVDYVLCFAYEYVKHISKINLTGYIKDSTKQRWLRLLHIVYDRRNSDVQRLDERLEALRSTPASEWPRECFCPEPCGHPEWHGEHDTDRPWSWALGEQLDGYTDLEERSGRKVREVLSRYQFDHHDSHPPVVEEVIGEARRGRKIRYDDPHAW
ncbi:hypothetical protein LTR53_015692 [Teratosphaeriaceae sp. CCFEE 6253]|nr:hypothetical protein LTR53_015692 [Teratosphaeriaceae sp. CCFEE 6253]